MNKNDLHQYQLRALQFVKEHNNCALLLECGLGKSIVTLTAIRELIDECEVSKVLVVAPLQVARVTWSDEAAKWSHTKSLRVSRVIGDLAHRVEALKAKADVYVLGRDSFVWLVKYYKARLPFDMVVLDELTSFKSSTSQRFKAFRLVRGQFERIVGLTGTPAPNGYLDLWGQMFCIDGGDRLGKYKTRYVESYFSTVMSAQHFPIRCDLRPGAKERIQEKIKDVCMSMRAEDYLSLPPISYMRFDVPFTKKLRLKYEAFAKELVLSVGEQVVSASNAAVLLGKLSQFCNGGIYLDESREVQEVHDEKAKALAEIVESAKSPVFVFYQFKHDIPRIRKALPKELRVREYEGEKELRDWNDGKIDVLLAHPASVSYGLNCQRGGHVIAYFGTGFNAETYQQSVARLYRQGQTHHVVVYHIVVPGTVDERALQAVKWKIRAQDALMASVKELVNKYGSTSKNKS